MSNIKVLVKFLIQQVFIFQHQKKTLKVCRNNQNLLLRWLIYHHNFRIIKQTIQQRIYRLNYLTMKKIKQILITFLILNHWDYQYHLIQLEINTLTTQALQEINLKPIAVKKQGYQFNNNKISMKSNYLQLKKKKTKMRIMNYGVPIQYLHQIYF